MLAHRASKKNNKKNGGIEMRTYTVFTVGKYNADILKFTIEADTLQKAEKKAKRYMNGDPLGLICGITKEESK